MGEIINDSVEEVISDPVKKVAHDFHVSKHTVYRMIKSGELAAFRVGGQLRILRSEVKRKTRTPAA